MEKCSKHDIWVTGCSKQVSVFQPEICQVCIKEEEDGRKIDPRDRSNENIGFEEVGIG